jgi:hypothetical protein
MNKDRFWSIVDATRLDPPRRRSDVNVGERNRRYRADLARLSPKELVEYQRALEARMIEAYRSDLWGAATLICDGVNESSFRAFRAWLVSQGREVFEAALRDPESLADNAELQLDAGGHYPAFESIPHEVYRDLTGKDMPDSDLVLPAEPKGKRLSEIPSELAGKFPRLYEVFYREEWGEEPAEPEELTPPPAPVRVAPMDEERFWALIGDSRERARKKKLRPDQDFIDRHITEHYDVLRKLTPEELIAYDLRFHYYRGLAYRWDLWAVAYWLHAGCSDDGFLDFRACLISLGKDWYFQVLNDPDSLTDLVGRKDVPYMQAEGFQYVDWKVYKEKTGHEGMPDVVGAKYSPREPAGERFDFEDDEEMRKRFPKLVARYPDMGD